MSVEWDSSRIRFRLLHEADLPRLYDWLRAPHVRAWWDTPASMEDVRAKYLPRIQGKHVASEGESKARGSSGEGGVDIVDHVPFVILYDETPIGYIQTYPVRVGEWRGLAPSDAIGLDLFIGDPAYVHRGLGPRILTRFLREVVFASGRIARCFVDPVAHNRTAIRAFEKAGFRHIMTIPGTGTAAPIYLMSIDKLER